MDGEELPYPGLLYVLDKKVFSTHREITPEDEAIIEALCTRLLTYPEHSFSFADSIDLVVMHARTSCTGVKPAMKNLAVFLKCA